MSGTKAGGAKAAITNLKNDPDFYRKIGAAGGRKGGGKSGFGHISQEKLRLISALGGINRTQRTLSQDEKQNMMYRKQEIINRLAEIEKEEREL